MRKDIRQAVINFGKHKGTKLIDIPSEYLTWLVENLTDGPFVDWGGYAAQELLKRERKARKDKRRLEQSRKHTEREAKKEYYRKRAAKSEKMESPVTPEECPF